MRNKNLKKITVVSLFSILLFLCTLIFTSKIKSNKEPKELETSNISDDNQDQKITSVDENDESIYISEDDESTPLASKLKVVDTVNELKTQDLSNGDLIQTLGYYEVNDGGGAVYCVSDSPENDDCSLMSIPIKNQLYANMAREKDEPINIKQLGAYGDGIHDDTSVFKEIMSCKSSNLSLSLLPGTYYIAQDIEVHNVDLDLYGDNAKIIGNGDNQIKMIGLSNLTIRGIEFENMLQLAVIDIPNFKISDCSFIRMQYNGISVKCAVYSASSEMSIEKCTFTDTGINEAYLSWADYGSAGNDIRVSKCYTESFNISSCTMSGNTGRGSILIYSETPDMIRNLNISDNRIDRVAFQGIVFLKPTNAKGNVERNTITNCGVINKTSSGVGCNGIFASSLNGAPNISVENNTISNVYENGIEGTYCRVNNNDISNTGIATDTNPTPSTEGIWGATKEIIGNRITNTKGFAIGFGTNTENLKNDVVIKDNIIINDSEHGKEAFHYWGGVGTNSTIEVDNNTIIGFDYIMYRGLNTPSYISKNNTYNVTEMYTKGPIDITLNENMYLLYATNNFNDLNCSLSNDIAAEEVHKSRNIKSSQNLDINVDLSQVNNLYDSYSIYYRFEVDSNDEKIMVFSTIDKDFSWQYSVDKSNYNVTQNGFIPMDKYNKSVNEMTLHFRITSANSKSGNLFLELKNLQVYAIPNSNE